MCETAALIGPSAGAELDGSRSRLYSYERMAEAGDPVHLSAVRTTNAGQGFHGFFRPTA